MEDFNIQSDSVDVEKLMEQIRARIREKRNVDYTEKQIRELATVKLEQFLSSKPVRSDLIQHYLRRSVESDNFRPAPNFTFDDKMIYESSRGILGRLISTSRKILNPVLKLLFNPQPIVDVLHMQSQINEINEFNARRKQETDALNYELLNNLVVAVTRMAIDVKNQEIQLASIDGRLTFDERRAKALEEVVQYRPRESPTPEGSDGQDPASPQTPETSRKHPSRRRRRPPRRPPSPDDLNNDR